MGGRRPLTDDEFVQSAYLEIFGRPIDAWGRRHFVGELRDGTTRSAVLDYLRSSDEGVAAARRERLPSLRLRRRLSYRSVQTDDGVDVPVYLARNDRDFAWLESAIIANGYYEQPREWDLGDNEDRREMASLVGSFGPTATLEIGCSSGVVVHHLLRRGVDAFGVDISQRARNHASDDVKDRIVLGDVARLDLGRTFDVVYALDVFEHVRPRRLPDLLAGAARHLKADGVVIANSPAYGVDRVFGEPFPMYIPAWRRDAQRGRPFRHLLVDAEGYPLYGHLVWATATWWTNAFAAVGLRRDADAELAVQSAHGDYFDAVASRRSMFVLRRSPAD